MSKKLEEKILEEIKRRVFDFEEKIKSKQENADNKEAMLQALDEISSLNAEQIKQIEAQVRKEMLLKEEKQTLLRRRMLQIGIFSVLILLVVLYYIFRPKPTPEILLMETFDNNSRGWLIEESFKYKRTHENNTYLFECNHHDWCYWDYVSVSLPSSYTVEVSSTWKAGNLSDTYGFILIKNDNNLGNFALTGSGSACYQEYDMKNWGSFKFKTNMANKGNGEVTNIQKVIVKNQDFQYFVNDKLVQEGRISANIIPTGVALRVCGKQKIAYNFVKITDNASGKILLWEKFSEKLHSDWEFKENFEKQYSIENGQYVAKMGDEDNCYLSDIPLPANFYGKMDKYFVIELDCFWQEGDNQSFGLVLSDNAKSSLSFNLQADNKANVKHHENGKKAQESNLRNINTKLSSQTPIHQKIILKNMNYNYEYYVNDQLIEQGSSVLEIRNIGFRICGKQTVRFDNLKITEMVE
jgi:hypothetical protein